MFCYFFVTLVSRVLFGMIFHNSRCLAQCFVCVMLTVCDVSFLRSVLYVFCLIVLYVNALRTVLNVFCKIYTYVSVLRTVWNVFFMIV